MKLFKSLILFASTLSVFFLAPTAEAAILEVDCNSGPYLTIQAAINASSPGDVVVVHQCSTAYAGFSLVALQDLEIVGADVPNGWIGAFSVGLGTSAPLNPMVAEPTSSCVHIEKSTDITITGLLLEPCSQNGFLIVDSSDIQIRGNWVASAGGDGVAIQRSEDIGISGNFLYGAAVRGRSGINIDSKSQAVEVQHNRVRNNWFGILMDGHRVDILNNDVTSNLSIGVLVTGLDGLVSRNTVLGNGNASTPQIDFNAQPPGTCVVGNDTNGGLVPLTGCQAENT